MSYIPKRRKNKSVSFATYIKKIKLLKGPIIYFFDGTSPLRREFLHLAGALMEHFLEGIALLIYWYSNPNEKSNKYKYSLLVLTEICLLQNEVNDLGHKLAKNTYLME